MLLKRPDGTWSSPVFYTLGAVNMGLQAGVQQGSLAVLLMNDKALDEFTQKNNFSLSVETGLTVVNWSKATRADVGTGDVLVWSSNKGMFGDVLAVSVNDVRYNQRLTNAYYQRTLSARDVTTGEVGNLHSEALQQMLRELSAASR